MNYYKLLQMQEELDNHIMKQHNLQFIKLENLVLSTIVELAEVTNDWQGFKHWKVNNAPKISLLEEIADFTHFLASLSNRFKVGAKDIEQIGAIKNTDISYHIVEMFHVASFMLLYPGANEKQRYVLTMWSLFKGLLEHLGFSEEQVYMAYLLKNKENYARQASGTY